MTDRMNELGRQRTPFLFIIDFEMVNSFVVPLNEVTPDKILYSINGITNYASDYSIKQADFEFSVKPVSKDRYATAFKLIQEHIHHGDSFLLNLTMPSKIKTNLSLKEIFELTEAKYKLWIDNDFVVFSPEIFIQTEGEKIKSFPMKGTIDASIPNAKEKLFNSDKELAEHYTIVDLIRNDLSTVAKNVRVERFRYIDKVLTHKGALLQMSSEIVGDLPENFRDNIGDIIFRMLPAGSISGAPKTKTLQIIKNAEKYKRNFYTGIFGIFNGENIDSGVMIRYIEQNSAGLIYKSGGGITYKSELEEEYQELIDKIYIPIKRFNKN